MSLFQCEVCGCVENTALACQGIGDTDFIMRWFDWKGFEDRKGKLLCSACAPTKYSDGVLTGYGKWHNEFTRTFLPLGKFKTNGVGNLEHIETGDEDYSKYDIRGES